MTRKLKRFTVYKYRMQMYGDPYVSLYAYSQKEAVAWVRATLGPGTWDASLVRP